MIIGDEHTAVIAASGFLPDQLADQTLLIPPAAFIRLELSRSLVESNQAGFGQISGPLSDLSSNQLKAIFEADSRLFHVISEDVLKPVADAAVTTASESGVLLSPMASQYVAASAIYGVTIWFGHDRNVPPALMDGRLPWAVAWRRLSELP